MNNLKQYPKLYFYRRLVQAKMYIDNNYAVKIDLAAIADEAYFSKYYFMRCFKEAYLTPP